MAAIEPGEWVFMPHEVESYLPAKVLTAFKRGEVARVETEDGEEYELAPEHTREILVCDKDALTGTDNLVKLNNLNEALILHNLRLRFKQDKIYTYVSSILIAVNPFRLLPLYTPEVLDQYKDGRSRDMPPHIFAIADNAYRAMLADVQDQSVIISGESGAGKTETMKLVLQFLAEVSGRMTVRKEGDAAPTEGLEQQILKANPVMEAFGNAKTLRNNNSSRFGKWTEVKFNRSGAIIGGSIINYLLEKSRLPHQAAGERNYHVFYQLLAGSQVHTELKTRLKLKDPEDYRYLNQSGVTTVDNINDEQDFDELRNAMDVLSMTPTEKEVIFRLLAAILHLGNIEFELDSKPTAEDGSRVKNQPMVDVAAAQLCVPGDALGKCLTFRNIGTRSVIFVGYTVNQAGDARDALCKTLYGRLFDWLIAKINLSLGRGIRDLSGTESKDSKEGTSVIGVLDIFGFESFETNSFEQLCINFCNEKLQFHFNEHIFKLEQEEYKSEGIPVDSIQFADNQPCLDLLEKRGTGIFGMIDEEINVPKGSDDGFLRKVLTNYAGKHANLLRPKPRDKDAQLVFIVKHYAGEVPYNVTNFLEKNKDSLHPDISNVIMGSDDAFIRSLLASPEEAAPAADPKSRAPVRRAPAKKTPTLGSQFKDQLTSLMDRLHTTSPHFVRCMKPNSVKKGRVFEAPMMLAQLRYAGLLEVCRIRQIGFPVRRVFDEFFFRYKCLDLSAKTHVDLLNSMVAAGRLTKAQYAVGHTKVFVKNQTQTDMETWREEALRSVVTRIQKQGRRYNERTRYLRFVQILGNLKDAIAARSEERLEQWLNMAAELPWAGKHVRIVQDATKLKRRLEEERRVTALLQDAIAARELNALVSALQAAASMQFTSPVVTQADQLRALIEEERRVLAELKAATKARNKAAIIDLLARAASLGLSESDEAKQALATKARIEEEEEAVRQLQAAIAESKLDHLVAAITRIVEMGLDPPELKKANALRDHLQAQVAATAGLVAAVAARSLPELRAAMAKAQSVQVAESVPEFVAARNLEAQLVAEEAAVAELSAAADKADNARIETALAAATKVGIPADHPAVKRAIQVKDRLALEAAAVAALTAAVASGHMDALSAAIDRAVDLGLNVPQLQAARNAVAKLSAQSEGLSELSAAVATGELAAIRAAITKVEGMGLGDSATVKSAYKTVARLEEEKAAAAALEAAVKSNNVATLRSTLADAERLNLAAGRYAPQVNSAKEALGRLDAQGEAAAALEKAIASHDLAAVEAALARAASAGLSGSAVAAGTAARDKLAAQAKIVEQLSAALNAGDKAVLKDLLAQAASMGLEHQKVREAMVVVDRDRLVSETQAALQAAMDAKDLDKLNVALERAIELGLSGPVVESAKAAQDTLERFREQSSAVVAAVKAIKMKTEGRAALTDADLEPLTAAMSAAAGSGLPADSAAMKQAIEMDKRCRTILEVQAELARVLQSSSNVRELREALERADDLGMQYELVGQVRAKIREMEQVRAQKVAAGTEPQYEEEEAPALDDDEVAKARAEKLAKASQPKFHWTKFPQIRDPDDFAKGVFLSKNKVKASQLKWQSGVLHKSLTALTSKDGSKNATRIHKALLGYAGDKSMSFPATLAQNILQKGLESPELVDEIYMQLCKHLTNNPRPESARAGWQVMCMAVGTFPPTSDCEFYLLNFILNHKDMQGSIGHYARYCLRRLEGIMNSGASGYVPSVEEIQAYKERPPILATIELVDGTPLTEDLPITPDLNVAKVLEICNHFLGLKDPRANTFGVFVEDINEEGVESGNTVANTLGLPVTPRPLQAEAYMGDVVTIKVRQNQAFKFVCKRKIFLRDDDALSEVDPMFNRLVYLQAVDDVIVGNLPVDDEEQVVRLVAQAMVIDLQEEMPVDPDELLNADMMEYVPIPWRDYQEDREWAVKVLAHRDSLLEVDPEELQNEFVEVVKQHPLYGSCFFYVRKQAFPSRMASFPDELMVAFNSSGLHFVNLDREILQVFGYADIYRWGGSSTQFSIILWNPATQETEDVTMFTSQAADMAALILDYINAIMAATEAS